MLNDQNYGQRLLLQRDTVTFHSELFLTAPPLATLKENAKNFLHAEELEYFLTLAFEKRQHSYLLGRFAAKQAISRYLPHIHLSHILIHYGVFQFPVVKHAGEFNIQVSWSHCNGCGIAIAFPEEHPMAIDLEKYDSNKDKVIITQLTPDEIKILDAYQGPHREKLFTLLWTAKEALSKVLRTGMTSPFTLFSIKNLKFENNCWISEFKNFSQYHVLSFMLGEFICSIVYPRKTQMIIDTFSLQQSFLKENE